MMGISNPNADGGALPRHGLQGWWYADVPLSPDEPNHVEFSFENGGYRENREISWSVTNVLDAGGMTIRTGDALLLAAFGDGTGNAEMQIKIEGEEETYFGEQNTPFVYRFDQEGEFQVKGTSIGPDGSLREGEMLVQVIGSSFSASPVLWKERGRLWDSPGTSSEGLIEFDSDIAWAFDVLSEEAVAFVVEGEQRDDRRVLVRLEKDGPVVDSATLKGIDIYGVAETGAVYIEPLAEGSWLVEAIIIQSRVFPGVSVQLDITAEGVKFADGSQSKELTSEDFNEIGQATVRFILTEGVELSTSHTIKAYDTGEFIGEN